MELVSPPEEFTGPRRMAQRAPSGRDPAARRVARREADVIEGGRGRGAIRRLQKEADEEAEPSLARRLADMAVASIRTRNWVTGLVIPIVAAIAVGVAAVVIVGANSGTGGPAPSTLSAGFPPARNAAADFTDTASLAGRGVSQSLGQVAVFGTTAVAVGTETGTRLSHARFFVSTDSGRTWRVAAVGGDPAPGSAATLVAGGPHGWVAVGQGAAFTSPNGQSWLPSSPIPEVQGDKIAALTATGSGFLAAGANIPGGDAAKATAVIWLSSNGTTWQRVPASKLALPGAGQVLGITHVAANGNVIVMSGTLSRGGSGAWRSANGGTTWTAAAIPTTGGGNATIAGLAPLKGGFVAIRAADIGGLVGADAYISADGAAWRRSASITTANGAPLTLGPVSGGPGGAVVTGEAEGLLIAFISADGVTWAGTNVINRAPAETVSGAALTASGQALISGTSAGQAAERQPVLSAIGPQGGPDQIDLRAVPGATIPEIAVNAIAASGAAQVAAGSADGLPALWASTDGGETWARAVGTTPAVLDRGGLEQLTSVTHGAAGWLAVGGAADGTKAGPIVVGSPDGQTWTAEDGAAPFTGAGLTVRSAAAGQDGYVIVGTQAAGGTTIAAAWYATGLTGWQRATDAQAGALGGGGAQMTAVTSTAKGFVAVGALGPAADLRPAAWVSGSGRTWSEVRLPLPEGATRAILQHVAANGSTVAAAGTEQTAAGALLPFAAVSADGGATWSETALPLPKGQPGSITALAAAGGGFTATGTYGPPGNQDVVVWTHPKDRAAGDKWNVAMPDGTGLMGPGTQAITALTNSGSTLTGVGFIATAAAEEPTIWQSPDRS